MKKYLLLLLFLAGCSHITTDMEDTMSAPSGAREDKGSVSPVFVNKEYLVADDSVFGMVRYYEVRDSDSLIEIARAFDLGFNEISDANPETDPFVPENGTRVEVPTEWILPDVKVRDGIIINISERRLFLFPNKNSKFVYTYPIGIGDNGTETPKGTFKIIQKRVNPNWNVPKSIRKEDPKLPNVVPPGPDNPLGTHALRLSLPTVLIHGTNRPWGIGRKVSHGCIQLYPEDIPRLFDQVEVGTRVTIVRQPVKVGTRGNKVYLEVHRDGKRNYLREALNLLRKKNLLDRVDSESINQAVHEKSGVPMVISD
ncbi:MAG TPA: L,D-transpeptidase family protein [Geobacteraceae bacterium]|nr:L,D-transpeptidase family protein [Geobacteraceae bacterium]